MTSILSEPVTVPCGLKFPNRLVKAAMGEGLAEGPNNDPNDKHITAYSTWASGGWGGVLTGNVEVSTKYFGGPTNTAYSRNPSAKDAWKLWATATQQNGTQGIVQICHPGRQSPAGAGSKGFFTKNLAPSAVRLELGDGLFARAINSLLFGTPKEMTIDDIKEVINQFAATAKLAYESGFNGVQLHAAHGYLLTQFLSARSNKRTDAYGGTPTKRAKIIVDIIRAIRAVVPDSFCVGIKFNSADVGSRQNLEDTLAQLDLILAEKLDFLELSGGSYEDPVFLKKSQEQPPISARTAAREAFFLDFAKAVRARFPKTVLMVTGGFRSRRGMIEAVKSGAVDLIGVGRPAAIYPHVSKELFLNDDVKDGDAVVVIPKVAPPLLLRIIPLTRILGLGPDIIYCVGQIGRMGKGLKPIPPPER